VVRLDGSRVNIWQDRKILSRVCNGVEHTYGLTIVKARESKAMSKTESAAAVTDRMIIGGMKGTS
jgi:hypothetical protein